MENDYRALLERIVTTGTSIFGEKTCPIAT
jgi:hypothetical protein